MGLNKSQLSDTLSYDPKTDVWVCKITLCGFEIADTITTFTFIAARKR